MALLSLGLNSETVPADARRADFNARPALSFLLSLLAHMVAIVIVLELPNTEFGQMISQVTMPAGPEILELRAKRIIYYRSADALPDVSPTEQRTALESRGRSRQQDRTRLATHDTESEQLIHQPELPPLPLSEIRAPNLIAFQGPRRPVKEFQPPTPDRPGQQPSIEAPPSVAAAAAELARMNAGLAAGGVARPTPRAFTPPPASTPRPAGSIEIAAAPAVSLNQGGGLQGAAPRAIGQVSAPQKPAPRAFVAPPGSNNTQARLTVPELETAPAVGMGAGNGAGQAAIPGALAQVMGPAKLRPRDFTPPPSQGANRAGGSGTSVAFDPAPVAGTGQASGLPGSATPVAIGKVAAPARPQYTPPPARGGTASTGAGAGPAIEAPPAVTAGTQGLGAEVQVAIIGLRPGEKLEALPPGSRGASFSTAPVFGTTVTGTADGDAGVKVPGLLVRDRRRGTDAPLPVSKSNTGPVLEILAPPMPSTFAVPLRPSSRALPRWVEARFPGRSVYTIVLPRPSQPSYAADWVLWFAERGDDRGSVAQVRSPTPVKKVEPLGGSSLIDGGTTVDARAQISAIIGKDGKLESITVLRGMTPYVNMALMEDFRRWEFRPATRDGAAVEVEAVFEIPYRVPQSLALRQP